MGQAKRNGTYEQRKAAAIKRDGGERRKRLNAYDKRKIARDAYRELCANKNHTSL